MINSVVLLIQLCNKNEGNIATGQNLVFLHLSKYVHFSLGETRIQWHSFIVDKKIRIALNSQKIKIVKIFSTRIFRTVKSNRTFVSFAINEFVIM
ncbi:Fibrous sheath-interacting protein [Dirofilaria immitis]